MSQKLGHSLQGRRDHNGSVKRRPLRVTAPGIQQSPNGGKVSPVGGRGSPGPQGSRQRGFYSEWLVGGSDQEFAKEASSGPHGHQPGNPYAGHRVLHQGIPMVRSFTPRGAGSPGGRNSPANGTHSPIPGAPSPARSPAPPDSPEPGMNGEYPERAWEPKVMVPFNPGPGRTPRKIEIERKKRLFAAQDIDALILEEGIDSKATNDERQAAAGSPFPVFLPLDAFDDTEFESRPPEVWLEMGAENGVMKGVPATALLQKEDGSGMWLDCKVTDYNPKKNKFVVEWLELPEGETKQTVLKPRIDILFKAENPFVFAKRVAHAHKSRLEAESLLRYNLYIDSMPTDELSQLPPDQISRIKESAINTKKMLEANVDTAEVISEINLDFFRSMNKLVFDQNLENPSQKGLLDSLTLPPDRDAKKPTPWLGVVPIPEHDFDEQFSDFTFNSFLTKGEVIQTVEKVRAECLRVIKLQLFNTKITKSLRLEEFEQMQTSTATQISHQLKEMWLATLKNDVKTSLSTVGKGWFNVHERNQEVYQISKLKKLMTMINFMMQDSVRFLVESSLDEYSQFIASAADRLVQVNSPADVTTEAITGNIEEENKKPPLFLLDIVLKDNTLAWSTAPERFKEVPTSLFDKAISSLQDIPCLEPRVMEDLFWSHQPNLAAVMNDEPVVNGHRSKIQEALDKALVPLNAYLETFEPFKYIMELQIDQYMTDFAAEAKSVQELKDEILKHAKLKTDIEKAIPHQIRIGMFLINSQSIRTVLAEKHQELTKRVTNMLAKESKTRCETLNKSFAEISTKLKKRPINIEELTEMGKFIETIPESVADFTHQIHEMMKFYDTLDEFKFSLTQEEFNLKWSVFGWPNRLSEQAEKVSDALVQDKHTFEEKMLVDQEVYQKELEDIAKIVAGFHKHTDQSKHKEISAEVKKILQTLKEYDQKAMLFNTREGLFQRDITEYTLLNKIKREFDPYATLWVTLSDWYTWYDAWMNDPFENIDVEELMKQVGIASKNAYKATKTFADKAALAEISQGLKQKVEEFQPNVPLIEGLRNPGMRDRHWTQLSEDLGFDLHPDETFTLSQAFEMKLDEHTEKIYKVAEVAGKEYAIEELLIKMEKEWETIELEIHAYRETGTYVMKFDENSQQMLDDHIVMTQSMVFSPYKAPFEERIAAWEKKLKLVSEVTDEWMGTQRSWLYLEPIFSSEDIMRQLPTEGKRFATVDRSWRKTLSQAKVNPHVLGFCANEKLLDMFVESNKLLDQVQKGLSDYLEMKRSGFARFYFLSNDELLEILSQTKDPRAVQPHLRKCFEAIAELEFQEDLQMTAMRSAEKEEIPFVNGLYPKGNVENWMVEVEKMMKLSVREQFKKALDDYPETARTEWVLKWPGMVVLNGCQTFWTTELTEAIQEGGGKAIKEYYDNTVLGQLQDLVELVRGELTPLNSITLGALIVIEVHARDVVRKMYQADVSSLNDFDWIGQLRYYWEEREDQEGVVVRMVQCRYPYGYEYLGNSFRLVITPLTDRCYMTLMGAIHIHLGGAPAGPAGTGKTETTKDLAKALAKQCVVFNCSDGLDYLAMGKFFKGLASAGAWACFDEFNRIDVEVLSVVAQQIMTITQGIMKGAKKIIFEGSEIPLAHGYAVFITMNPGYAGRTELPDNLKALFRPMSMMVPDYGLIAEISLYSFGFQDATSHARKIVATFKLSSEQLSSQDHYDFGMRAVKSVINAAGNLKRAEPNGVEELQVLRALSDVNLPKFLTEDLPLFRGILSDLFPGVTLPTPDYDHLIAALKEACSDMGIQPVPVFLEKCIQLYETTTVRHGLMLVGPTGGGKTCCYNALASAQTKLKAKEITPFNKVFTHILNPKSITMGQLYGQFDDATHEWTDGILAKMIRVCSTDTKPDRKWVMFDGPVDAIWIENMNTVLDDNKKLCLNSGEIIKLSPEMVMMFEVEDLSVASPATVSRCGMVYMEPKAMGTSPLFTSWAERLPPNVAPHREKLQMLFDTYVEDSIYFSRKKCKESVTTVDNNLVSSLFNLLDCFFKDYIDREGKEPVAKELVDALGDHIEPLFIFSLIWSIGGALDGASRPKFDQFLRDQMEKNTAVKALPKNDNVFSYKYDLESGSWINWLKTVPQFKLNPRTPFADILVPTVETIGYTFLLDILVHTKKQVLIVGETGTGKSVNVAEFLMKGMDDSNVALNLTFSARTSANQTQDLLDGKMDKRRKGIFGPPAGKRYVIFVDDMNMPAREKYFAQPPIELLRQWQDHGGWYDRKSLDFREIIDIQFVGAMGPPGGGRNPVTNRFLRHFNFISFSEMNTSSLQLVFETIISTFLDANFGANEGITALAKPIVAACVAVYLKIAEELLPTPAKSHYTFNLRDMSKVVQGILSADKKIDEPAGLVRLWWHECARVFRDRLINEEDRDWFDKQMELQMTANFGMSREDVLPAGSPMFGDFMVPGADPKIYSEITDYEKLQVVIEEYLEDFNATTNKPMRLVMFLNAIEHVARISRIIRQPRGNALLLGVGGSGRQSLTRLAAAMSEYEVFQIEVAKGYGNNEWREDLKKVLLRSGMEGISTVFLFSDTQIVLESFLEDINNILNSGEVPNLFGEDDIGQICNAMTPIAQSKNLPTTKLSLYSLYLSRVKTFIHIVLAFSPIGDAFRNRLRMFPSLVNCCTIDWFTEWPREALQSVAKTFLGDVQLGDDSVKGAVQNMCMYIHKSVEEISKEYLAELRRHNYVTPTSYLELLGSYQKLLQEKRDEVGTIKSRLEIGLDKLASTAVEVAKMQEELVALQPVLKAAGEETDQMMVVITEDKVKANETKEIVEKQEASASAKAAEAKAIADDAQKDLDEALPALDAAVSALKNLNKGDIVEVRSLIKPPAGVKLVMEAVCVMKGVKPKKVEDPNNVGKKIDDYWDGGKALLSDPGKFLDSLFNFDKDNIPETVINKIQPYIANPDFTPAAVEKVSRACKALCEWVRAMDKYHHVAKGVEPKRKALRDAQAELEETMATLNEAKDRLQTVEDKIADLEAKYDASVAKKEELARKVDDCQVKLERAEKLIGGLGGEKTRWMQTVETLTAAYTKLVGDVLISAGAISYLGAFTAQFRKKIVEDWQAKLKEWEIPHTEGSDLRSTVEEPVKTRMWIIAGLPADGFSIENGIIISKARRWPLMIDPQTQANKWVKNMEADNGLEVIRLTEKDYLRTLENGIRFGKPVLLENIEEELDSALEPVLLKQTFKQGGSEMIKLGDNVVAYNPDFRFYLSTKLSNPHYPPEVCVKVTLLNFTITQGGLQDQVLGIVVAKERPDLEEAKSQLVIQNAQSKKQLKEIEDKILFLLANSQGNILDDEELINTLAQSKLTSAEIEEKVKEAEITEKEIDETRAGYTPVAYRGSILFFCISNLASIDPMYQYSLTWYINLFVAAIQDSEKTDVLEDRLHILSEFFTYSLYNNVCRSLFEKHKLLFSFLLTTAILEGDHTLDAGEYRYLIAGPTSTDLEKPNPSKWLEDKCWIEILNASKLPALAGFDDDFTNHDGEWQEYFNDEECYVRPLPGKWDSLDSLQKMLVLRCIRPDKVIPAIQNYIIEKMERKFIEPPPFDLPACYRDTNPQTPLVFVLSQGADPMKDFLAFADEMRFGKKLGSISLGQGQGPIAEQMIADAMERGTWVMLQNCHLAVSWMPSLEKIVEAITPDKVHRDFRLWLTSMPTKAFPVAVLQNSVKVTNEPPKGLRANLLGSYSRFDDNQLDHEKKPTGFKKLLYGICFFHAVIGERKKFGPLGWNIAYEFSSGDLDVCIMQIREFLEQHDEIPYRVLHILCGDVNYGGRVTDDKDRRCLMTMLNDYMTPSILNDDYNFSPSGVYYSLPADDVKGYREKLADFPLNPFPEVFGLHQNADITCAQNETDELLGTVLSLQAGGGGGGGGISREDVIDTVCSDLLKRLPPLFDLEIVFKKYPTQYEESLNTVLSQECIRYNKLLAVMKSSLSDILKALKGLVVMSEPLDNMGNSVFANSVPDMWQAKAYPSLKPLSSWFADLELRVQFLNGWIDNGVPPCFWFSGFFFPQAFLTGTLQNFARKHQYAIDACGFGFKVVDDKNYEDITERPADGIFIRGLFLEGARWDYDEHVLTESRPKELFTDMPVIWLVPHKDRTPPADGIYECPCYKILTRAGTLSTTGHSTNFVIFFEIPSSQPQSHWIKRGVALVTQLRY